MINVRSNETCYTQITERIKVLILIEKYSHLVFDREETCGGPKQQCFSKEIRLSALKI